MFNKTNSNSQFSKGQAQQRSGNTNGYVAKQPAAKPAYRGTNAQQNNVEQKEYDYLNHGTIFQSPEREGEMTIYIDLTNEQSDQVLVERFVEELRTTGKISFLAKPFDAGKGGKCSHRLVKSWEK